MLEMNRCKLSNLQEIDYVEVKQLYFDAKVREFLGGTIDDVVYTNRFNCMLEQSADSHYWVIRQQQDNQFIGLISLDLHHNGIDMEISYQLLPKWWGQGYATEVVKAIISYSFKELQLQKVVAETQVANKSSCKLLERVGMKQELTFERFGAQQVIYSIYNVAT